jgi:PAS domain S-box-containing protein
MSKHEQFLNAILDASLDGIIALSEASEVPYVTSTYSTLFPGWENLRYKDPLYIIRDFYSKYVIDVDKFIDIIAQVRLTRELREVRIHLKDGRILHIIGKIVKTFDGYETEIWVHRDITEQCKKDDQLQLRLQIITAILNASSDAIFTIVEGIDTPFANTNYSSLFPGWEKFLYCYSQPLKELENFFSQYLVDWETHNEVVAEVRKTRQYQHAIIHHKDGRIIDMSGKMVNAELIQGRNLEIYTLKDITEEVRSRQRMRAMQLTVDNLSEPVVWCDISGKITYVNQTACAALGYDEPAEIIGKPVLHIYETPHFGNGVSDTWSATLAALRTDTHVKFDHATLAKKDGARLHCMVLIDYITQGSEPFLAMCFHDLTEQIQRIEAERAAAEKSEFLARTSHEIRTPMNAVIGLSELARREYGKPEGLEYIMGIQSAGASLLAIINDILDLSQIESGNLPILRAPYETASLLNDTLSVLRTRMVETPLELITDISPDIPGRMTGDARRIRQILLNLLGNAVKYTHRGFIKFSASGEFTAEDTIRLTFTVEDSGIGIKSEDLPKLFEAFQRFDEKRNIGIEGTGLGLAIARSLCGAMGGDITVRSEYGKGSVFSAVLFQTVADRTPVGDITDAAAARSEMQRITFTAPEAEVLIVDDLAGNLMVAEGLLMPYRVRVFTCLNGREAVALVRERPFDLVLMDHMMPEMDGVEATLAIRAMDPEYCRTMPIVALTANAVSGMSEMFLANGFNDFLSKPIEMSKLDAVLKKWIPADRQRGVPEAGACGPDAVLPPGTAPPDIAGLDAAAGIARMGGSSGRYLDLLETFRRDAQAAFVLLETTPEASSLRSFTTLVHALKSALANIGADGLSQAAALLEKAGRGADLPALRDALPVFREELSALTARIGEFTASARSAGGEGRITPEMRQALTQLREALEAGDVDAVDAAQALLQALSLSEKYGGAVSEIADYILTADFDKALDAVIAVLGREK